MKLSKLRDQLRIAAAGQNKYESLTINLIAAANATPLEYVHNLDYSRYAIVEGLLGKRPYAGVKYFDTIEHIAVEAARVVFDAEYANVQPHSGSQANQAVYQGLLTNGDTVLAMDFNAGGHLTHGLKRNFSGRFFNFIFYGINKQTHRIDYDDIERKAKKFHPKLIVCGASSYPRKFDFECLGKIAKRHGALLMADLSHPAGLIAARRFPAPFPFCDVVTMTLDKTLRGPHAGLILAKNVLADRLDKGVHPGVQSSVPLQRIYQIALCLIDAGSKSFQLYIDQLLKNIKVLEREFSKFPNLLVTGGTDSHMIVLNTYAVFGITGKEAELALEKVGLLTNRQVIPFETLKPYVASGLRIGSAWATSRGYNEHDFQQIAHVCLATLQNHNNRNLQKECRKNVQKLIQIRRLHDTWRI